MNTKIGTSFGLALLMAIAVVATMFAMGMLTPKPTSAAGLGEIDVAITPATAYANGQYTIAVSGGSAGGGITAIPVGGTITVTFGTKFTVPASIATERRIGVTVYTMPSTMSGVARKLRMLRSG